VLEAMREEHLVSASDRRRHREILMGDSLLNR
jgi:hypothetical protein